MVGYVVVSLSLHGGRTIVTGFLRTLTVTMVERFAHLIAPAVSLFGAALFVAVTLLSALHPQLLERDPLHVHVVIGGTRAEQARALAAHVRRTIEFQTAGSDIRKAEVCRERAEAHVLSIRGGDAASASVFSVGGLITAGEAAALMPGVLLPVRLTMLPELPARIFTPSVPDPPPRAS